MTDEQGSGPDNLRRPIVNGLVALLAVALTVGGILAGIAVFGANYLGLGGEESASGQSSAGESMYVPEPAKTTASSGPLFTLATEDPGSSEDEGESDAEDEASESTSPTKKDDEKGKKITLSAGQTSVANFGQIDLTGVYPGGEGAVLQVQRFENGAWADFDATIPVSGESFSTYVQTGVSGVNRFRVTDPETQKSSNEVRVTVE